MDPCNLSEQACNVRQDAEILAARVADEAEAQEQTAELQQEAIDKDEGHPTD